MCTFSMTIKTFLLCLCLTACNGNEEVTEAETSSGYPSLLNKTVPVPAEYLGETASQASVVQIDYDTRNYVDGNGEMRSNTAYVYLPYGYKESSDECYDVFYFVHGHGETAASFFQNENGMMRNLLDHLIEKGDMSRLSWYPQVMYMALLSITILMLTPIARLFLKNWSTT